MARCDGIQLFIYININFQSEKNTSILTCVYTHATIFSTYYCNYNLFRIASHCSAVIDRGQVLHTFNDIVEKKIPTGSFTASFLSVIKEPLHIHLTYNIDWLLPKHNGSWIRVY